MESKLELATWNANELAEHSPEVILNQDIDILRVSETHFTNKRYLRIPRYTLFHTKHPDGEAHVGTTFTIRSSIKHFQFDKRQTDFLQATNVMIETLYGCITISAVSNSPLKQVIKSEQYINFFEILSNRFIAAGDYNAKHIKWDSRLTSRIGRKLLKAIDTMNTPIISKGDPTYWPTDSKKIPVLLDFGINRSISKKFL